MARSGEKQMFAFTGLGSADDPSDIVVDCQLHPRQPHGISPRSIPPIHPMGIAISRTLTGRHPIAGACCAVLRPPARVEQESVDHDEVVVARHDEVELQGNLREPSAR
jgi:hypothetical protein